jgi:hypothetical protein
MPTAPGWVLGVQWHPEWGFATNPHSVAIFAAFGDACRAREHDRASVARERARSNVERERGSQALRVNAGCIDETSNKEAARPWICN